MAIYWRPSAQMTFGQMNNIGPTGPFDILPFHDKGPTKERKRVHETKPKTMNGSISNGVGSIIASRVQKKQKVKDGTRLRPGNQHANKATRYTSVPRQRIHKRTKRVHEKYIEWGGGNHSSKNSKEKDKDGTRLRPGNQHTSQAIRYTEGPPVLTGKPWAHRQTLLKPRPHRQTLWLTGKPCGSPANLAQFLSPSLSL